MPDSEPARTAALARRPRAAGRKGLRRTVMLWVLVVAAVGATMALSVARLPDADRLTRTAESLPAPESWGPVTTSTEPARFVCLGGNPCPSAHSSWTVPSTTTLEDFLAVIDQTGWDAWGVSYSASCHMPVPLHGNARGCLVRGVVDGVQVHASYSSARPEGSSEGSVVTGARYP